MKTCRCVFIALFVVAALFVVSASAQEKDSGDKKLKKSDLPAAGAVPLDDQEFVKIGGLDQWISIRGKDPDAPVLLIVDGGPGAAWSGFFVQQNTSWEGEFIVVRWDQRGAGRTFGRSGPVGADVTIDRMAQDGVEVAEFVRRRLHKDRVILMGISWGSVLGVHMIKARPDLFYAYVGVGQVVNWPKGEALAYTRVLTKARAAGDQTAIDALEKIGPPALRATTLGGHSHELGGSFRARGAVQCGTVEDAILGAGIQRSGCAELARRAGIQPRPFLRRQDGWPLC